MIERLFLGSSAAPKGWIAVVTPSSGVGSARDIAVNSAGDVFLLGMAGDDQALSKFDKNASLLWQRRYYPTFAPSVYNGRFAVDSSNNVFVCNWLDTYNPRNSLLLKYSSSGPLSLNYRFIWVNDTYNGAVLPDTSGNVYASYTRDTGEGGGYYQYGVIRKNDSALDNIWTRYITCNNFPSVTSVENMKFDASGNIIATGWTFDLDLGDNYNGVYKVDSSGNLVSSKHISGARSGPAIVDSSGNIYIENYFWDGGKYVINVMKMNSSYVVQWQRNIAASGGTRLFSSGICLDQSNNIYVAFTGDDGNAYVAKYNASGSLQWQRQFNTTGYDSVSQIVHDGVSNFYITGTTNVSGSNRQFFAKLPDDGTATGTYVLGGYSYGYTSSSLSESAGSLSTVSLSITAANAGMSRNTNTLWADAAGTQTVAVKTV